MPALSRRATPDSPRPPAASVRSRRTLSLAVCAALVAALLAVAVFAPLPFAIAQPGITADVLGESRGEPVVTVSDTEAGAATANSARTANSASTGEEPQGELLMTTIEATSPDATVRVVDVLRAWFATEQAVMPLDSVYPVGDTPEEIHEHNTATMKESQQAAVRAALDYLGESPNDVEVELRLSDVGGPSAGLLFSLGIIDKMNKLNKAEGDGRATDLTGGRTIAGTGTITPSGTVGAVGGVPLKTQAAKRDGATAFLVPKQECAQAKAELPAGLRLIPVVNLSGAVDALEALRNGGRVPAC